MSIAAPASADQASDMVLAGLGYLAAMDPATLAAHVSLAELRVLDDGSVLQQEWIGEMAIRWATRRAAASQTGNDGAAWLEGKAARAMSCDATVIPVVTGQIDPGTLDDLVSLCLLCRCRHNRHLGSPFSRSKLRPWLRSVAGCTTRAR
jgi:hypothetical protein